MIDQVLPYMNAHPMLWVLAFACASTAASYAKEKAPRLAPVLDVLIHLFPLNVVGAYRALTPKDP